MLKMKMIRKKFMINVFSPTIPLHPTLVVGSMQQIVMAFVSRCRQNTQYITQHHPDMASI